MSTKSQPLSSFEALREPTGQELAREATTRFAVFNLERAVQDVEAAAIARLKAQQAESPVITDVPELNMPQASVASMAVESSANDEDAARNNVNQAFDEVFKNAN